jgi:hypothetical protein
MRISLVIAGLALLGLGAVVANQSEAFAPAQPRMRAAVLETVATAHMPRGRHHGRKLGGRVHHHGAAVVRR